MSNLIGRRVRWLAPSAGHRVGEAATVIYVDTSKIVTPDDGAPCVPQGGSA